VSATHRPAPLLRLLRSRRAATLIATAWIAITLTAAFMAPAPVLAPMATVEASPVSA
jgi:hypothetical protein